MTAELFDLAEERQRRTDTQDGPAIIAALARLEASLSLWERAILRSEEVSYLIRAQVRRALAGEI